jgi:hypothetical protein
VLAEMALLDAIVHMQNEEKTPEAVVKLEETTEEAQVQDVRAHCETWWSDWQSYKGSDGVLRVLILTANETRVWAEGSRFKILGWRTLPGTRVELYRQVSPYYGVLKWQKKPAWKPGVHEQDQGVVELYLMFEDGQRTATLNCASKWFWWQDEEKQSGYKNFPGIPSVVRVD